MIQAPIQKDAPAPASAAVEAWAWGVNDQWEPRSSSDNSKPYHYWWLKKGTAETLAYDFDQPYTVSSVQVYWLDFDHYDGDIVCRKVGNSITRQAMNGGKLRP